MGFFFGALVDIGNSSVPVCCRYCMYLVSTVPTVSSSSVKQIVYLV